MRIWIAAFIGAAALSAGAAHAAPVTDVDNFVEFGSLFGASTGQFLGGIERDSDGTVRHSETFQTWTVGVSGTLQNVQVEGDISHGFNSTVSVTAGIYGGGSISAPGTQLLGEVNLSVPTSTDIYTQTFDFSGLGITATAGEVLTLKIGGDCAPVASCLGYFNSVVSQRRNGQPEIDSPAYAGGTAFSIAYDFPMQAASADLDFRTVMQVSDAPEPTSWALMVLGFGGLGAALRGRRRLAA